MKLQLFPITHNKTPVHFTWELLRVCAACPNSRLNLSSELRPSWEQHPRNVPHLLRNGYNNRSRYTTDCNCSTRQLLLHTQQTATAVQDTCCYIHNRLQLEHKAAPVTYTTDCNCSTRQIMLHPQQTATAAQSSYCYIHKGTATAAQDTCCYIHNRLQLEHEAATVTYTTDCNCSTRQLLLHTQQTATTAQGSYCYIHNRLQL